MKIKTQITKAKLKTKKQKTSIFQISTFEPSSLSHLDPIVGVNLS